MLPHRTRGPRATHIWSSGQTKRGRRETDVAFPRGQGEGQTLNAPSRAHGRRASGGRGEVKADVWFVPGVAKRKARAEREPEVLVTERTPES
jgi:hypothetical protein